MTGRQGCISKSSEDETQPVLPRLGETQCFTPHDHLRDAVLHAHTDMTVGIRMLRRGRLMAAWKKMRQGYYRLGRALDSGVTIKKQSE
ncbi:MAG: hypothetical protein WCZ86_05915 [Desulfurivibrionaceae bacterium]|jgi:hypothetical protein